jgi:hypothetical protein
MAIKDISTDSARRFIILVGLVSLCSDVTYEGARLVIFSAAAQLLSIPLLRRISKDLCLLPGKEG